MSTVEREPATLFIDNWSVERVVNGVLYGLFGAHLLLVVLAHSTGLVQAWHLAVSSVLLGALLGCRLAADAFPDTEQFQSAVLSILGLTFVVLGVVYQSSSPGLGLGPRRLAVVVVLLVTVSFLLVVTDARQYTKLEWFIVGCFAVLSGIYLVHSLEFDPSSSQSRWQIWAAIALGTNLFVLPRLIPERVFLWMLSRFGAVAVVLGLFTYVFGEYSLWIFEMRQWSSSPTVPGIETDITTIQSFFPNPNSFGLVAFAGFAAAIVEFHRSVVAQRPIGAALAFVLAGLCGLGVFLSNARASMLAAAVVFVIYTAYALGGRLTVPIVASVSVVGVLGLLVAMYANLIDISSSGRFELWRASLRAIRDGPLLFGHGSGSTSPVIEPYLGDRAGTSPHNAYLTVLLQTGLVGGLAYLGVVVGSIVTGLVHHDRINVAMLAFAIGWAMHQGFESYTMFRWSLGAALAAITFGYLITGD